MIKYPFQLSFRASKLCKFANLSPILHMKYGNLPQLCRYSLQLSQSEDAAENVPVAVIS